MASLRRRYRWSRRRPREPVGRERIIESGLAGDGFTAITNDERSAVGRAASLVLPLCAGTEAAIAAKTYTNSLALVKLMAAALEGHPATESVLESLERAASVILDVDDGHIGAAAERLLPGHAVAFVGRGPAYASARQCALTFIEGARGLAAAFTGGGFRHGPMELAGPELRAVFLAPEGVTRDIMAGLASEAAAHGAGVVVITDSDVAPADGAAVVRVPRADRGGEELFPLAVSGAHALLLDRFAAARGIEAGHFVRGSKVTSKE